MKKIISTLLLICLTTTLSANVRISMETVSSYIWRGTYNAGASFQPKLEGSFAGFTLGAWGSTDFVGQQRKEADLSLNYSFKGLTVGLTDYWWEGEGAFRYFDYSRNTTCHRWEGTLSYQLPFEQIPLRLSWNTMFAGNDFDSEGNRAYSTYIEVDYPFNVGQMNMNATIGVAPWQSPSFLPSENKGFSVCNLMLKASRTITLSESLSLPIFTSLIFNPATEDIHVVFGLSLSFGS